MLNELTIIIVDSFCVQHQFVKIVNILLDDICHIFELSKLVTIVIRKHAFRTNDGMAEFTEVLDFFVLMLITEHLSSACLCNRSLWLLASSIGYSHWS